MIGSGASYVPTTRTWSFFPSMSNVTKSVQLLRSINAVIPSICIFNLRFTAFSSIYVIFESYLH